MNLFLSEVWSEVASAVGRQDYLMARTTRPPTRASQTCTASSLRVGRRTAAQPDALAALAAGRARACPPGRPWPAVGDSRGRVLRSPGASAPSTLERLAEPRATLAGNSSDERRRPQHQRAKKAQPTVSLTGNLAVTSARGGRC